MISSKIKVINNRNDRPSIISHLNWKNTFLINYFKPFNLNNKERILGQRSRVIQSNNILKSKVFLGWIDEVNICKAQSVLWLRGCCMYTSRRIYRCNCNVKEIRISIEDGIDCKFKSKFLIEVKHKLIIKVVDWQTSVWKKCS